MISSVVAETSMPREEKGEEKKSRLTDETSDESKTQVAEKLIIR
jgi:hypothetical protein